MHDLLRLIIYDVTFRYYMWVKIILYNIYNNKRQKYSPKSVKVLFCLNKLKYFRVQLEISDECHHRINNAALFSFQYCTPENA